MEFYVCEHCGNLVGMVHNSGVPMKCCGQNMTKLEANTTDAAVEKHVPEVKADGQKVSVVVGSTEHPMTEAHLINWIAIKTKEGAQRKVLTAESAPKAEFMLTEGDQLEEVYAYCNLHGLWKAAL